MFCDKCAYAVCNDYYLHYFTLSYISAALTLILNLIDTFPPLFYSFMAGVEPDPCSLYLLARTTFVLVILARGQKSL